MGANKICHVCGKKNRHYPKLSWKYSPSNPIQNTNKNQTHEYSFSYNLSHSLHYKLVILRMSMQMKATCVKNSVEKDVKLKSKQQKV